MAQPYPVLPGSLTQDHLDTHINFFRVKRGLQPLNLAQADAVWRRTAYVQPQPAGLIPFFFEAIPPPAIDPRLVPLNPPAALPQAQQTFMDTYPPGLGQQPYSTPADSRHWLGRKYLGSGTYGMVGVWEYTGPEVLPINYLAVKETLNPPPGLEFESGWDRNNSDHSVTVFRAHPRRVTRRLQERQRLFFEYHPLGSVQDLVERREEMGLIFEEHTLWAFFNCLVDGAAIITDKQELNPPEIPGGVWTRNMRLDPNGSGLSIDGVHFDIQPANVLVGGLDVNHPEPVLKICDYGMCVDVNTWLNTPWALPELADRERYRIRGQDAHLAPEQFTERWETSNVIGPNEPIAGNYSEKTNIWGIATVMYVLATLDPTTSPTSQSGPFKVPAGVPLWAPVAGTNTWGPQPYLPGNVNGVPAKGLSHGFPIRSLSDPDDNERTPLYSQALVDLITECLYDNPSHRPTLGQLKQRIVAELRLARIRAAAATPPRPDPEPYDTFIPFDDPILLERRNPGPGPPVQDQRPVKQPYTPQEIVDMFAGRPPLPDQRLNNMSILCRAMLPLPPTAPTRLCNKWFVTDGITSGCGIAGH